MWLSIKRFVIAAGLLFAVSVSAVPAHATTEWSDSFESGEYFASNTWLNGTLIPQGSYAYDTAVKVSGARSLRLNFTEPPAQNCQNSAGGQPGPGTQCGGSISRSHTGRASAYYRIYMRIGDTSIAGDGDFQAYVWATTKMFEVRSNNSGTGTTPYSRGWFTFGCCGVNNTNFMFDAENAPTSGAVTRVYSSPNFSFQNNVQYCIEYHVVENTPDVSDGIVEAWVDGVRYIYSNTLRYLNSGATSGALWNKWSTIRQGGRGNIWYDDLVVGDARIGCPNVSIDVTPPPVPSTPSIPSTGLPATVNWVAVSDTDGDLAGYNYYRKLDACSSVTAMTLVATLLNVLTYADTSIPGATVQICVKVASRDVNGNISAQSTGFDKTLAAGGTASHVLTNVADATGADFTFGGAAYKLRYWNDTSTDFCTNSPSSCSNNRIETAGLGGVLTYRLSSTWSSSITFMCAEAQGSDGIWETESDAASYVCDGIAYAGDISAPHKPTGLRRR